ncbi:hypothetical protein LY01_00864 [Nonlabens xylanidelens]|uniref:Outer membrane protein with beta-barrel domain n=1 Tax=Nonlabens xylanidelens TaxID=191564 RepID=A0A2S6IS10_9FLAO|nr:hypothetical protein [Nonlabens xylanidelens]PPK97037.1 hypothetical protein LY01_00864 [Nonlabens xylanidelens]PQJ13724.1 hypothetical protein BST94_15395 [Nonlabens xylanidelens]
MSIKNKFLLILILVLLPLVGVSQSDEKSNLFDISLRSGFSSYEVENLSKSIAVNYGAYILKEIKLSDQNRINLGLGINNFQFDYVNSNQLDVNVQNSFIELPIGFKRYVFDSEKKRAFVTEIGVVNRFKVDEDITSFPEINIDKDFGYNLAYAVSLGYHTTINTKMDFSLGLIYSGDLFDSGYNNSNVIDNQISIYFDFKFFN